MTTGYSELRADHDAIWGRFYADFGFRPHTKRFPGITEPAPSVTWSFAALDDDPGYSRLDRFTDILHAALTTLAGDGSVLFLDWQHTGYRVWPGRAGFDFDRPGWLPSPFPDGDYSIYLAEDFRYGTFGHPWEASLCVFGAELLQLIEADLDEVLGPPIRRRAH
ncbi:hypothetical protein Ais01nite_59660 [Asanoa ishikariensis]|uniref:DUF2716 domain-containing protein n=1 Tax=Asanoa ishikariensis TaxID=137265 RepID=A0A1H3PDY4_9ACTN|nr:DUF2716 domain-containing protein [Asanoa ishikariensis]GIF67931.1 hypothetical protein Ais01nite_59660 [Asanoa ishikariensis]SDY98609.1 Protein of unknown function [Asanoa ishikariensis]